MKEVKIETTLDNEQVEFLIDLQLKMPTMLVYSYYFRRTRQGTVLLCFDGSKESYEYFKGLNFIMGVYEKTYSNILTENKEHDLFLLKDNKEVPSRLLTRDLKPRQLRAAKAIVETMENSGIINSQDNKFLCLYGSEGLLGAINWFVKKFY